MRIGSKSTGEEVLPPLRYFASFFCLHHLRHEAAHRLCGFVLLLPRSVGVGAECESSVIVAEHTTGGSRGLTDIPKKTSLLLVWVILLAVIVILSNFLHSKHGRNCIAVREEELAAKSIGIDVIRYKMLAFLISCALCGLAGGLLAGYMGYLYPTMFTMAKSNELTMTVILGGTGSLTGTILAGLVLIPLPEYLRIESAEEWRMVLYGVLVVAVIVFKPSGLMGSKEFTVAGGLRRCKQLAARVRKRGSKRDKEGEAKK